MNYAHVYLDSSPGKSIKVFLDENPLNCDCQAFLLRTFSMESFHLHLENIQCANPESLQGRYILQGNTMKTMKYNDGSISPVLV